MLDIRHSIALDGTPRIIADADGRRYYAPLTGGVPQFGARQDVSDWMGINIQCVPQAEINRRKKTGEPSLASLHDLGERAHTYYPATLAGLTLDARQMLDLFDPLPAGVTRTNGPIYRDFVNTGQLTETGEYTAPGREQFMRDWIAAGGRVLLVNAALHNESPDNATIEAGPDACLAWLRETGPQGVETMRRIARLIARLTPQEQAAVVAVEAMNEPAIYQHMERGKWGAIGLTVPEVRALFEADQAAIARTAFAEGIPDHVLILLPRYGYNAASGPLLEDDGNGCILSRWLDEFGDRIGISTHKYADWIPGTYTDEWLRNGTADLNTLSHVPQVLTETHSSDFRGSESKSGGHHAGWTMADLCLATGVAPMYFPAANWGGAPIVNTKYEPDRVISPDRLFTWLDTVARLLRPEPLDVRLPHHAVRSKTDARYSDDNDDDRIKAGLRIIRMGDGDAEIVLSGPQAIMCYGGEGNQRVTMNRDEFSWFSGWRGNDTVDARDTPGCIINLGDGDDVILLGGRDVTVAGRGGGDAFILADTGNADVFGFDPSRDRIHANDLSYTIGGKPLRITTAGGGTVTLHGQIGGKALEAVKAAIIR